MKPDRTAKDSTDADRVQRPSFVLVQQGLVVAHFAPDQAQAAADTAYRLTERDGRHVGVYAVDHRLPPPPAIGERVDPASSGWVDVD